MLGVQGQDGHVRGEREGHVCGVGDMGTGWAQAAPRSCMDPKGGCMHGTELQAATASNEERCLMRNGAQRVPVPLCDAAGCRRR